MTTITPYTYAKGKDPQFDAYKAKWQYNVDNAWQDAKAKQDQAKTAYQDALSKLATQATTGRQNLATSLLQRGIYSSGEAMQRRAQLEAARIGAQTQAQKQLANSNGATSTGLERTLGGLNLDWESNLSQALARLKAGSGGGGGGGGGGYVPPKPTVPAPFPSVAPPSPYDSQPGVTNGYKGRNNPRTDMRWA